MKISNIGSLCIIVGALFYCILKFCNADPVGGIILIFFGSGINVGALAQESKIVEKKNEEE